MTIERNAEAGRWEVRNESGQVVASAVHLFTLTRHFKDARVVR